jgi:hypothetical protein
MSTVDVAFKAGVSIGNTALDPLHVRPTLASTAAHGQRDVGCMPVTAVYRDYNFRRYVVIDCAMRDMLLPTASHVDSFEPDDEFFPSRLDFVPGQCWP